MFIFLCVAVLVVGKDSVEVDEDVAVDVQDVVRFVCAWHGCLLCGTLSDGVVSGFVD